MARASSVNFQPVNERGSEAHNTRTMNDKYGLIHSDLSKNNQEWNKDSIKDRLSFVQARCKQISGRKLQKNATPIREGIVNIKPTTTMDDLHKLAKAYKDKFDLDVFQMYIHRDEGKRNEKGDIELNQHAHIVVDWTSPKTGKMLRLGKQDMRDLQTLTAEVLGMKRGKSSELKHLSVTEYKAQAQAQEKVLNEYKTKFDNVEKEIAEKEKQLKELKEFRDSLKSRKLSDEVRLPEFTNNVFKSKKVYKELVEQVNKYHSMAWKRDYDLKNVERDYRSQKQWLHRVEETRDSLIKKVEYLEKERSKLYNFLRTGSVEKFVQVQKDLIRKQEQKEEKQTNKRTFKR